MEEYLHSLQEELAYLETTVDFIKRELDIQSGELSDKKRRLLASRKDMWENAAPYAYDTDRLAETSQYLAEVNNQTAYYNNTLRQISKHQAVVGSPYFGRFDFLEDGCEKSEKVYIGLYNVIDPETHNIYVYDWRAPISSIYYRHELGRSEYQAPDGLISGDVSLKRQYKIRNSKLEYFFDCSLRINDEMLREILSRNASAKMRNIVESIQKEQDAIIRDTDNDLLIVQGVVGSGKTSVALHRVAFLLYEGLNSNLRSRNIIIISPNAVFSKYISSVLPELGEEAIGQITFEAMASKVLEGRFAVETRDMQLEALIAAENDTDGDLRRHSIDFKGSRTFIQVLDRLLWHCEHRLIAFEDVGFDGVMLETRQQLKNRFLNNKTGIPVARRLKRIEEMILAKVHSLQKARLDRIESIVENSEGHEFEVKSFSRLLSIKRTQSFLAQLRRFTRVDYWHWYQLLFERQELFFKLARGLELPEDIEQIIEATHRNLQKGQIHYEDCPPILYLMLKVEGCDLFSRIKQVVIDEAQDYCPLQYKVFKLLFKNSRFTVLGDFHQSITKELDWSIYDDIVEILNKRRTIQLVLHKSYRSTYEINLFTKRLLGKDQSFISFERNGEKPAVLHKETTELMDRAIIGDIERFRHHGYQSIAVICKTQQESEQVYAKLKNETMIELVKPHEGQDGKVEKRALVIPSHMAKGLEFDVVIVYNASRDSYSSPLDKRLLYIACTRALHQLLIYYTGEKSPLI